MPQKSQRLWLIQFQCILWQHEPIILLSKLGDDAHCGIILIFLPPHLPGIDHNKSEIAMYKNKGCPGENGRPDSIEDKKCSSVISVCWFSVQIKRHGWSTKLWAPRIAPLEASVSTQYYICATAQTNGLDLTIELFWPEQTQLRKLCSKLLRTFAPHCDSLHAYNIWFAAKCGLLKSLTIERQAATNPLLQGPSSEEAWLHFSPFIKKQMRLPSSLLMSENL